MHDANQPHDHANQPMAILVGNLLRAGVLAAAAVVLLGAAVFLTRHGSEQPDYRIFHGQPSELRTVPGIIPAAFSFGGRAIIQLGLLILIATPVCRVAVAAMAFAWERDWLYVAVGLLVFTLLLYSLLAGSP
jgi:uncharacterized membrane protein